LVARLGVELVDDRPCNSEAITYHVPNGPGRTGPRKPLSKVSWLQVYEMRISRECVTSSSQPWLPTSCTTTKIRGGWNNLFSLCSLAPELKLGRSLMTCLSSGRGRYFNHFDMVRMRKHPRRPSQSDPISRARGHHYQGYGVLSRQRGSTVQERLDRRRLRHGCRPSPYLKVVPRIRGPHFPASACLSNEVCIWTFATHRGRSPRDRLARADDDALAYQPRMWRARQYAPSSDLMTLCGLPTGECMPPW